jgi:hypothetical protein
MVTSMAEADRVTANLLHEVLMELVSFGKSPDATPMLRVP